MRRVVVAVEPESIPLRNARVHRCWSLTCPGLATKGYPCSLPILAFLSDDQRMLRKRSVMGEPRYVPPPPRPQRPNIPTGAPLPPMFRALPYSLIDMFEEFPERFSYISETRPDMD